MSHLVPSSPFTLRDVSQNKVNFTVYGLAFSQGKWGEIHGLIITKEVLETQHWLKFLSFFSPSSFVHSAGKVSNFQCRLYSHGRKPHNHAVTTTFLEVKDQVLMFWLVMCQGTQEPFSNSMCKTSPVRSSRNPAWVTNWFMISVEVSFSKPRCSTCYRPNLLGRRKNFIQEFLTVLQFCWIFIKEPSWRKIIP